MTKAIVADTVAVPIVANHIVQTVTIKLIIAYQIVLSII